MGIFCDSTIAARYKSKSQIARVVSEAWVAKNGYCLACASDSLRHSKANTPCTDFVCDNCDHRYELKTFLERKRPSAVLPDGAYTAMMQCVRGEPAPSLLLLERSESWRVKSFTAIPSVFLSPIVIEKRPPLRSGARRAGWTGCNIRLDKIGPDGRVFVVRNDAFLPKDEVRQRFRLLSPLARKTPAERGWTTLTLSVVRDLGKSRFTLQDVYENEQVFAESYPENQHVRDKIRQQLQVLRDLGIVRFEGRGSYAIRRGGES